MESGTNYAENIGTEGNSRVQIGNNYSTVHNHVTTTHFADRDKAKLRTDFLRRLNTSSYLERKDRNPERANGTCEWFTTHRFFEKWKAETSAILWVSADPGCGKSVLAKHLVDDVLSSGPSRITCYFFFKDDFEDQKSLEGALCCILHQLFTQQPTLLSNDILKVFEEEGNILFSSFSKLWAMLIRAANGPYEGEIICILDALDECVGYKDLAKTLAEHFSKHNGISRLKFLVTSRPYRQIQQEFQHLKASQPTIHLSGDSQEEVDRIAGEITIAIKYRIEDLGRKRQLSRQEREILDDELTTVSHRTYLWVHLVFAELEGVDVLSKDDWRTSIRTLPRTVEEAYSRILSKSTDPERTRRILQIIVAAERPLKLTEMAEVLAFRVKGHTSYEDLRRNTQTGDRLQVEIRHICGLFVVIQHDEIFLLHQTAREFLVCLPPIQPKTPHPSSSWQHSLDLKVSHGLLAEICIKYLLLAHFQESSDVNRSQQLNGQPSFVFLDYAASNWIEHYREAQSMIGTDLESLALKLCDANYFPSPHWLEVYAERRTQERDLVRQLSTPLLIASYFGLHNLVNLILDDNKESLNKTDNSGRTALSWASEKGYDLVTQLLLNRVPKAKVLWKDKWLSSSLPTIVNRTDERKRSPLWYAAARGHQKIVKQLLEKGAKVDTKGKHGIIPLFSATANGHTEYIYTRRAGVTNIDGSESAGQTALIAASGRGHDAVVKLLLDSGANVNASDNNGQTALIWASINGYDAIVKLLLDGGANVNASDKDGWTALIGASINGHDAIFKLLLDGGANVNASDKDGQTALIWASINGHDAVVKLLLDSGANVNASDKDGQTALIGASEYGHDAIVKLLLDGGANVNASDKDGQTALINASEYDYDDVVKLLLDSGANVNASDNNGQTALSLASRGSHHAVVKLLREKGAKERA